jgi:hypothetical protein
MNAPHFFGLVFCIGATLYIPEDAKIVPIIISNPLGAIIKNVNSSVFCEEKRNKKSIDNRF